MLTEKEREQLQADLEREHPDQCRVERRTQGSFNAETGFHDQDSAEELYEGACRLMPWTSESRQLVVGEEAVVIRSYWLTLPLEASDILPGDMVVMTASADPELVGRELVVKDIANSTMAVERRVVCEDVLGEGVEPS